MRAWAKKRFTYNGIELEPGQIFEMVEARNDQKLLGLNFCARVETRELKEKGMRVVDCDCGMSFVDEPFLRVHQAGNKHPKAAIVLSVA